MSVPALDTHGRFTTRPALQDQPDAVLQGEAGAGAAKARAEERGDQLDAMQRDLCDSLVFDDV